MEKNVYLFVCENMADWEPALAIAMISDRYTVIPKKNSYRVITFGLTKDPVKTFGGLTIHPDTDITEIGSADTAMIILPGSTLYEKNDPVQLVPLIESCMRNKIPVAAICGATVFLAKHGFLDTIRHTSAGPGNLASLAPHYRGREHYVHEPSVIDGGIITANPLGFAEFAYNIIKTLDVFTPEVLEFWMSSVKKGYLNTDSFR
ncbi:MAG TPA: type 1 glutamine amidotransferase family protein [Candidatus Thermoplasmatota archaeon]|nr:type 1 glutamine amidotransferase family protein [Candidatus Thermoplasmatota archaeon]